MEKFTISLAVQNMLDLLVQADYQYGKDLKTWIVGMREWEDTTVWGEDDIVLWLKHGQHLLLKGAIGFATLYCAEIFQQAGIGVDDCERN